MRNRIFALGLALLNLTGCVSVSLDSSKNAKSKNISFRAPSEPFSAFNPEGADEAWQNRKTGTSISFHSSCFEAMDPTLEMMQKSFLEGIENAKIKDEVRIPFNGREALDTKATGKVDGVIVSFRIVLFKKNNCNFDLSYVALDKNYQSEMKYFDNFLAEFKVP